MKSETLADLFWNSVEKNAGHPALGYVGDNFFTYSEVGEKAREISLYLKECGVEKGDKIGILATNQPHWGLGYFGIVNMGAVAVPVLPDFHADEVTNIIKHSDTKILFVSKNLLAKLQKSCYEAVEKVILIDSFKEMTLSGEHEGELVWSYKKIEFKQSDEDLVNQPEPGDVASIIYTSGTTGSSKGVMLSHENLSFTVKGSLKLHKVTNKDRLISLLPLSHTLENTVGFLLPFSAGASMAYLRKPPTPSVLMPALKIVKPTIILAVPLIIEKIFKGKILPEINSKSLTRTLYKLSFFRKLLHKVAGKKLMETFGGEVCFFGVGGAKLDPVVERFLVEANFPYAVGYGLTETAPLLAGFDAYQGKYQSTGCAMEGVTLHINNPDPVTGEGEIWAKGRNVMKGYYKEPELTAEVITEDGWFRTGDLGTLDEDGFLFIKGRLKNMIVGASGENIYPEEIEAVINRFKHVLESIVVQKKGKLVAMVHFNREELDHQFQHLKDQANQYVEEHVEELLKELHAFVNERVNKFSRVQLVLAHDEPFEKTATKKIKRFLYY